jgi:hypothetical protein
MTIEALISDLIKNLPNLAIAVAVLYWQKQTIDSLLAHQRQLIDKLIEMVSRAERLAESNASAAQTPNGAKLPSHGGD